MPSSEPPEDADLPDADPDPYVPVLVHRVDATLWARCLQHRTLARRSAWVLSLALPSGLLCVAALWALLAPSTPLAAVALAPVGGAVFAYVAHAPLEQRLLRRRIEQEAPGPPLGELGAGDWATIVRTGGLVRGQHHYRATAAAEGTDVARIDLDTAAYRSSPIWTWDRMA